MIYMQWLVQVGVQMRPVEGLPTQADMTVPLPLAGDFVNTSDTKYRVMNRHWAWGRTEATPKQPAQTICELVFVLDVVGPVSQARDAEESDK